MRRLIAVLGWYILAVSAINPDGLHSMRSRDLYRLARKLGVDDELPPEGAAVEKSEIISLLAQVLEHEERKKQQKVLFFWLRKAALGIAGLLSLLLLWQPVCGMLITWCDRQLHWCATYYDMTKRAQRSGSVLATLGVLLSGGLEVFASFLQTCVLISWVAPTSWRRWLLTSYLPPLTIDPAAALSGGTRGASSGWSVNLSPLIATHLISRVQRYLSRFVGDRMRRKRAS